MLARCIWVRRVGDWLYVVSVAVLFCAFVAVSCLRDLWTRRFCQTGLGELEGNPHTKEHSAGCHAACAALGYWICLDVRGDMIKADSS